MIFPTSTVMLDDDNQKLMNTKSFYFHPFSTKNDDSILKGKINEKSNKKQIR